MAAEILLNPYCSLQELRDEIRNNATDEATVNQLTRAINDASRAIDGKLGRDFLHHDHTTDALVITRDSDAIFEDTLFFPYRCISVTEVKADDVVLVEDTDYSVVKTRLGTIYGLRNLSGRWFTVSANGPGWSPVKFAIKGNFGYVQDDTASVPTDLPAEVRRACILIAAAWSGLNSYEVIGLDGQKQQVASKEIPKAAWELLKEGQPIRL